MAAESLRALLVYNIGCALSTAAAKAVMLLQTAPVDRGCARFPSRPGLELGGTMTALPHEPWKVLCKSQLLKGYKNSRNYFHSDRSDTLESLNNGSTEVLCALGSR